jgi:hypothetical protein
MVRITITAAAYQEIVDSMPLGIVAVDPQHDNSGRYLGWIEAHVADRLDEMRRDGESYSDVIIRLAGMEPRG